MLSIFAMLKIASKLLPQTIYFNWLHVIIVSYLFIYGFCSELSAYSVLKSDLVKYPFIIILMGILALFLYILNSPKWSIYFNDSLTLNKKDVFGFISLSLISICMCYSRLFESLYTDELSYASASLLRGQNIITRISQHINLPTDMSYSTLLWLTHLTTFLCFVMLVLLGFRLRRFQTLYFVIFFIIMRYSMSGIWSVHPPLHHVVPLVGTLFLGINSFAFKFSYFFSALLCSILICKMIGKKHGYTFGVLVSAALLSIPLVRHMLVVIEQSNWSFMCFTLVMTYILTEPNLNYFRAVAFISLFTMFRQPAFILLIPLGIHWLIFSKSHLF